MDRIYVRAKFGHAQHQHLQVMFSQHQDLPSHFNCLGIEVGILISSVDVIPY